MAPDNKPRLIMHMQALRDKKRWQQRVLQMA